MDLYCRWFRYQGSDSRPKNTPKSALGESRHWDTVLAYGSYHRWAIRCACRLPLSPAMNVSSRRHNRWAWRGRPHFIRQIGLGSGTEDRGVSSSKIRPKSPLETLSGVQIHRGGTTARQPWPCALLGAHAARLALSVLPRLAAIATVSCATRDCTRRRNGDTRHFHRRNGFELWKSFVGLVPICRHSRFD